MLCICGSTPPLLREGLYVRFVPDTPYLFDIFGFGMKGNLKQIYELNQERKVKKEVKNNIPGMKKLNDN